MKNEWKIRSIVAINLFLLSGCSGAEDITSSQAATDGAIESQQAPIEIPALDGSQTSQLSAQIDLTLAVEPIDRGLKLSRRRISSKEATMPSQEEVENAFRVFDKHYFVNQLYLIHHHQAGIKIIESTLRSWKEAQRKIAPDRVTVIPALILKSSEDRKGLTDMPFLSPKQIYCNFSDSELEAHIQFLKANINSKAIAIYRSNPVEMLDMHCDQLPLIRRIWPEVEIHYLNQQPGEDSTGFAQSALDTFSAQATGFTDNYWLKHCFFNSKEDELLSGRDLLASWVDKRVGKTAFQLSPIGFTHADRNDLAPYINRLFPDWMFLLDLYADQTEACGADLFEDWNEPMPASRMKLIHDTIISRFPGGGSNRDWGGFSVDLLRLSRITLHQGGGLSYDPDISTQVIYPQYTFHGQLRKGLRYFGKFSAALSGIAEIFAIYRP